MQITRPAPAGLTLAPEPAPVVAGGEPSRRREYRTHDRLVVSAATGRSRVVPLAVAAVDGSIAPPGYRDGIIVTPRSLHDTPPPDDPLLADERFRWLLGLAFRDGSLSRQRANRAYLCLFGDLREETQDRLENFCGKRGIPNAKHGPYLHNELLASGLHRYALSRNGVPVKSTERRLPREPHRGR